MRILAVLLLFAVMVPFAWLVGLFLSAVPGEVHWFIGGIGVGMGVMALWEGYEQRHRAGSSRL